MNLQLQRSDRDAINWTVAFEVPSSSILASVARCWCRLTDYFLIDPFANSA